MLCGAMLVSLPFWQIWRRHGEITLETTLLFMMMLPLPQRIAVITAVEAGAAMLRFGVFLLLRPH